MYGIAGARALSDLTHCNIRYKPIVVLKAGCAKARCQVRPLDMEPLPSEDVSEGSAVENEGKSGDPIAQYVVIRKDLVDSLKWPLGSVLAQACHAAVAAVWLHKDHPHTLHYCGNLDSMTTVTLEVKGEAQLISLSDKLRDNGIAYKLWIEQPENFPTCLATKPYPKSEVSHYFKKLKLCK